MVDSTATAGNLIKGGARFLHNFGVNNTFLGANAGNLTMSGMGNTASGASALSNNTSGNANTASGANALLSNTTGYGNTASGEEALFSNTTGSYGTASGHRALVSNTTGVSNTASGSFALLYNTTGSFNTASGAQALLRNTTGTENTASGSSALVLNTTGNYNTAIGSSALNNNTSGSYNTALGYGADVPVGRNLTNATAIGAGAVVNASNKVRIGNAGVSVIEGQVPYTFSSDKTKKENFKPVRGEEVLGKIRGLELTSWNYIGHDPKQFRHYGPMAQDFFAAFGSDGVGTIGTPTTINSGDMAGILMIAIQALEKRTADLANLRSENAELEARIEALERH